jgi:phage shock protein A
MAFRNKELVDRGFTNIKSQVKALDHTVARGGVNVDDFRKEVRKLYDKIEDLETLVERESSHTNG